MFENYWFLLLLLLPLMLLFFNKHKYYLRHAYIQPLINRSKQKNKLHHLFFYLGWSFLVLASINVFWGFVQTRHVQSVHKFVMLNDGSGSMVDSSEERGVGQRLVCLHKGNQALLDMLGKRDDGSFDLIGAIVFSNEAFVVSYMVDDPKFVSKKLAFVDYTRPPLNSGTELAAALWSGIDMILSNEKEPDDDLRSLQLQMFGQGHNYKKEGLEFTIEKYHKVSQHACIIIFTDGEFFSPAGGKNLMSIYKLLHLCKDLGIKTYVLSVETVDNFVEQYTKDTGGFSVIFHDFEESKFRQAYENIFDNQTKEEIVKEYIVKKSLATISGFISLFFFITWLALRLTLNRSFTEI